MIYDEGSYRDLPGFVLIVNYVTVSQAGDGSTGRF
jgi:hypothetical protein